MYRHVFLSLTFSLAVCACGGPSTPDEAPAEQTAGDPLEACETTADKARALATAARNGGEDAWLKLSAERARWAAEEGPCARPGAKVTERMHVHGRVLDELKTAEEEVAVRLAAENATDDPGAAFKFLRKRFATGQPASGELTRAAYDASQSRVHTQLPKFREAEKYAQLDDKMTTTCIFSRNKFDPQTKDIEPNFTYVFEGGGDVHSLCRLPLPASKYADEGGGKIVIVLDDDTDPTNGIVYEGELGSIEELEDIQFFRGRFSIPQGIDEDAKTAYYHVSIKVERPGMEAEYPVDGGFFWFASR